MKFKVGDKVKTIYGDIGIIKSIIKGSLFGDSDITYRVDTPNYIYMWAKEDMLELAESGKPKGIRKEKYTCIALNELDGTFKRFYTDESTNTSFKQLQKLNKLEKANKNYINKLEDIKEFAQYTLDNMKIKDAGRIFICNTIIVIANKALGVKNE